MRCLIALSLLSVFPVVTMLAARGMSWNRALPLALATLVFVLLPGVPLSLAAWRCRPGTNRTDMHVRGEYLEQVGWALFAWAVPLSPIYLMVLAYAYFGLPW